jgi:hypothetical protein
MCNELLLDNLCSGWGQGEKQTLWHPQEGFSSVTDRMAAFPKNFGLGKPKYLVCIYYKCKLSSEEMVVSILQVTETG